jgi:hypothetical protein
VVSSDNYVEKYMPFKIQNIISETLQYILDKKTQKRLQEYEKKKFTSMNLALLNDNGKPEGEKNSYADKYGKGDAESSGGPPVVAGSRFKNYQASNEHKESSDILKNILASEEGSQGGDLAGDADKAPKKSQFHASPHFESQELKASMPEPAPALSFKRDGTQVAARGMEPILETTTQQHAITTTVPRGMISLVDMEPELSQNIRDMLEDVAALK